MNSTVLDAQKYIELNIFECDEERGSYFDSKTLPAVNYSRFIYVTQGVGTIKYLEKPYAMKKGQLFYIPQNKSVEIKSVIDNMVSYVLIGFSGAYVSDLVFLSGFSKEVYVYQDNSDQLGDFFEDIYRRYTETNKFDLYMLGSLFQVFSMLIENNKPVDESLSKKEKHISAAKDFIYHNYQYPITILDIANSVGVTPNYLANVFDNYVGCSPKKFLTKIRMDKACQMLSTGHYKIKDVGKSVGYDNQLHFSSEFKKAIGISPLLFIKNNKID